MLCGCTWRGEPSLTDLDAQLGRSRRVSKKPEAESRRGLQGENLQSLSGNRQLVRKKPGGRIIPGSLALKEGPTQRSCGE